MVWVGRKQDVFIHFVVNCPERAERTVALTTASSRSLHPGPALRLLLQAALDSAADGTSPTGRPRRGLQPERRRAGPGGLVGPSLPGSCE